MNRPLAILSFIAVLSTGGLAAASDSAGGQSHDDRVLPGATGTMSGRPGLAEIVRDLESRGYTVRDAEMDDGYYEIKVIDAEGRRLTANIDPATGKAMGRGFREGDD